MPWKHRVGGGLMGFVGFMLSPLSWWNDLLVNVPIAVGFGWLASLVYLPAFNPVVVVAYWLTNIVGLILMHKGAAMAITGTSKPYTRKALAKDFFISLLYTALILLLIRWKVIQPVMDYFKAS